MGYAVLVRSNLLRNPRRTILTTLAVALSLFAFSMLASLPGVADQILADRASSLRVICHGTAGLFYTLPEAFRHRIERSPHVEAVTGFTFFGGIYHEPSDQFPNVAVDHEVIETIWPDWGISPEEAAAFKRERIACLAGPALMERFKWHVGQQIMLRGTIYPVNLTLKIVGDLGGKAPPPVFLFRRDYLDEATGHRAPVNMYLVKVDRAESIAQVITDLDRMFANSGSQTLTESESGYFSNMVSNFRALFAMARALGILIAITICLAAANTAAMSVRERHGDIAILRSLGFSGAIVLGCFIAEGVAMGTAGGIAGCAFGYAALRYLPIGSASLGPLGLAMRMPAGVAVETLALGILVGAGSAAIPGALAVRRNIVETLRYVG
jgi:putative ABC transport system permease protein